MPNAWNKTHIQYSGIAAAVTLVAPTPAGPLGSTAGGFLTLHAININQITPGTGASPTIDIYDYNNPAAAGPAGALIAHIVPGASPIVPISLEEDAIMTVGIEVVIAGTGGSTASAVDITVLWV